jgi:hypothetical protein
LLTTLLLLVEVEVELLLLETLEVLAVVVLVDINF